MAHKAPGKHFRKGLSLVEITRMFPDDATAERWFVETRWPDGVHCPACGSTNVQERPTRKPQPYRCRDCRKDFSVKLGTLMEGSKLGFQVWAVAIYLLATSLKSVSSMKLHRDLGITQKTAWYLAQRIREIWRDSGDSFTGPVEADETYIGGKRKNMPKSKRAKLTGRGAVGKAIVVGAKDREANKVAVRTVENNDGSTLKGFVAMHAAPGAKVFTDEASAYQGMDFDHEAVNHSAGEYVRGMAHTNGIESFWALLKRGYIGTYHFMSFKHLHRYVDEFAYRQTEGVDNNIWTLAETIDGMVGRRLTYRELIV
jgi:transposase-like protein